MLMSSVGLAIHEAAYSSIFVSVVDQEHPAALALTEGG